MGEYTAGVGLDIGRKPTLGLAGLALIVAGVAYVAQAIDESDCIHRCR